MGGFDGIRSLNQRLRNTDFGRSKNLMDFIDMKNMVDTKVEKMQELQLWLKQEVLKRK